jgi:hypothetical protein
LANQPQQEAARQIDQQRAKRKCAAHLDLHQALQAIARQRPHCSKHGNQEQSQGFSSLLAASFDNKKLLAPRGIQESSVPAFRRDGSGELHRHLIFHFSLSATFRSHKRNVTPARHIATVSASAPVLFISSM